MRVERTLPQFAVSDVMVEPRRETAIGGGMKRAFDVAFALVTIASLAFLFLIIAGCIRARSRGPVIFAHYRVGHGGRLFPCLKFRTMVSDAQERLDRLLAEDPQAQAEFARYQKLRTDPRIIPGIGTFLRKTSLDELPQLFNVLAGHMSVVGPRPVTEAELVRYGEVGRDYVRARPGLTGLWQVSGRNQVSFEERVLIDRHYLRSWSFGLDLKILARTGQALRSGL